MLQMPVAQNGYPVTHRHGLSLVVGDIDRRSSKLPLKGSDVAAHLHTKLRVEIRQRLVHERQLRLTDESSSHRHALTLSARQLRRLLLQLCRELQQLGNATYLFGPLFSCHLAQSQRKLDVLEHCHLRV